MDFAFDLNKPDLLLVKTIFYVAKYDMLMLIFCSHEMAPLRRSLHDVVIVDERLHSRGSFSFIYLFTIIYSLYLCVFVVCIILFIYFPCVNIYENFRMKT